MLCPAEGERTLLFDFIFDHPSIRPFDHSTIRPFVSRLAPLYVPKLYRCSSNAQLTDTERSIEKSLKCDGLRLWPQ